MKVSPLRLAFVLAMPLTALHAAPTPEGQTIQQLLSQAQVEYMRGETDAAKHDFETVLQNDPRSQVASNFLRRIQVDEAKNGGGKALEKDLSGIIIPKVEFKEANFESVLDFLKKAVTKATEGKKAVNFVSQLSPEAAGKQITLSLTDVPFGEVLHYVGTVAGARFTFEKYAIMVKPATGDTASAGGPAEGLKPK